ARAVTDTGSGPQITVRAPVCISGSAVGSARLALAAGLGRSQPTLGKSLRLHPGVPVAGLFDEVVEGWLGIPQSYECTEKLKFDERSDERVWIVPAFAHPIGLAAMLPGFGKEHMRKMRLYPNLGVLVAMIHDQTAG